MRLVHFSDIHVGDFPRRMSSFFDKRLLGTLNFYLRRQHKMRPEFLTRAINKIKLLCPEWIICTGDLSCVGTPEELARAMELLEPLRKKFADRFIYVPGNHDFYVRNRHCEKALQDVFYELNGHRWHLSELPQKFDLHGLKLLIVNECCATNWFLSTGRITATARDRLREWLDAPRAEREKRILIGHFPLRDEQGRVLNWRRCLSGEEDVLHSALREGRIDISLCGHIHEPFIRQEASGAYEVCAGSLTVAGKINVIDYIPETGKFRQFWENVADEEPKPAIIRNLTPAPMIE